MEEKWLKDIHDRMSDYEIDQPANLWSEIESSDDFRVIATRNRRRHAIILRLKRVSAVAAIMLIALSLLTVLYKRQDITLQNEAPTAAIDKTQPAKGATTSGTLPQVTADITATGTSPQAIFAAQSIDSTAQPDTASITSKPDIPAQPSHKADIAATESNLPTSDESKSEEPVDFHLAYTEKPTVSVKGFSMGIHTSGGFNATARHQGAMSTNTDLIANYWNDNIMYSLLMSNKEIAEETETHHRLPLRAGISITYRLSRRISIGSGLTYTNLTSDITGKNHYTAKQTLHYIGIPLNIRYDVLSWKAIDLYISGGVLAEKCIAGKLQKNYMIEGQNAQSSTENIMVKPIQWSINASAGVQYNITSSIGAYIEPGVSYHFDNGSPIRTIYSDRPTNFNLDLGLRFTLNGNR